MNPATGPVPPCPATCSEVRAPPSPPPPPGGISGVCGNSASSLPVFSSYFRTFPIPWSTFPMYANPLLSTAMPCPCGGSKEPITLPSLSKWIIEGGRLQQSAIGGVSSASSSISVRSLGRSSAHTLSSLSTAKPVMPPIFHLLGSGLGQSGSNLNLGAASVGGAPRNARKSPAPKSTAQTANTEIPAILAQAFVGLHPVFTIPPP